MRMLVSYLSGVIFAVGLVVGGMTQPQKIVQFLDFFGNWDPSLAFVMGGALLVNIFAYQWTQRSEAPVVEKNFYIPTRTDLDWQLMTGGALFGVGWGVSGYCPGPALTSVVTGSTSVLAVVGGMIGGVFLYKAFDRYVLQADGPSQSATDAGPELRADA